MKFLLLLWLVAATYAAQTVTVTILIGRWTTVTVGVYAKDNWHTTATHTILSIATSFVPLEPSTNTPPAIMTSATVKMIPLASRVCKANASCGLSQGESPLSGDYYAAHQPSWDGLLQSEIPLIGAPTRRLTSDLTTEMLANCLHRPWVLCRKGVGCYYQTREASTKILFLSSQHLHIVHKLSLSGVHP